MKLHRIHIKLKILSSCLLLLTISINAQTSNTGDLVVSTGTQFSVVDSFTNTSLATFFNGNLVVKYGMKKLATSALYFFSLSALVYTLLFFNKENPSVYVLLPFMAMQFLCIGFIFGNVRALAMQPIGHIAGVGASLNGFISTMMAVPLAILIGYFIDETALPLFVGFLSCGLLSILLLYLLGTLKRGEG